MLNVDLERTPLVRCGAQLPGVDPGGVDKHIYVSRRRDSCGEMRNVLGVGNIEAAHAGSTVCQARGSPG
jgi:hypothetical protein